MKIERAYSLLNVKEIDQTDSHYTIRGIASTPTPDRMGDIVEPMGAKFKLPMPLLWQHHSNEPIGQVTFAQPTKNGIPFEAKVPKIAEAGALRDRIEEAIQSVKHRLVAATSIGFRAIEGAVETLKGGGYRFKEWEWLELSLVTIPANSEATITSIKSFDQQQRAAASGEVAKPEVVRLSNPPGVSGNHSLETKGNAMNVKEQLTQWEAKRSAAAAAMVEIMTKSAEAGESLDTEAAERYETLKSEVGTCDKQIDRLKDLEKMVIQTAKPATEDKSEPTQRRVAVGEGVLRTNQNLPKGIGLARYAKAIAWGRMNMTSPIEYAKQWDDSTPEVSATLKTAVGAGTTTDSTWASPLVYANNLVSEFVDYLRPMTILGKLDGVRRVPFNIRYPIQNGGSTVAWVGQGAPKPVSKLSFTSGSLGIAKAAGIVVLTQELVRFSSPAAELVVRDDMAAQMVYFLDQQFIDPGVAAVSNVSPASILNGASNVRQAANAWTSMANVLTDVKVFLSTFASNEIALNGAYWIMTPDTALSLSLLLTTGGENRAFPDITIDGGSFCGIPVIVSNSVPHSTSAGAIVALVKASEVFLADDGGVNITVSGEASLNMDTAPTNNSATPTATSVVSMFQTDSIAIRAERFINWSLRRTYGVGYIDNMHTS